MKTCLDCKFFIMDNGHWFCSNLNGSDYPKTDINHVKDRTHKCKDHIKGSKNNNDLKEEENVSSM